ncbi:MAG: hypothetical protein ABIH72_04830 [archaeon]
MEINLCGTRKSAEEEFSKEAAKIIAEGLLELSGSKFLTLETGGTIGFPEQVVYHARKRNISTIRRAYTPVSNKEEWDEYKALGIGDIKLYDYISFTPKPRQTTKENIRAKAMDRINRMLSSGDATIAYTRAGEPCTTKLETQISAHLGIPTYVLTPGNRKELQHEFEVVEKSPIKVYDDPIELLGELNKLIEKNG